MGIKSPLEMYQRAMDEMLEGLDHANAIMDNILVAGATSHTMIQS